MQVVIEDLYTTIKSYSFPSERYKVTSGSEGIGPVDGCKWTASFSGRFDHRESIQDTH